MKLLPPVLLLLASQVHADEALSPFKQCRAILADALHALEKTSRKRGFDAVDLSLLTDGLQAEREQGITIDVAYRYFSTGTRKFIIADAPGHEQYTRNMVTAASTAHLAIILIDARKGVLTQTRRHTALAHLMGIPHLVAAVNKMDLVGWSQETFQHIREEVLAFATKLGIPDIQFVPMSALEGDMVVERGEHLPWYQGPTLMEILESAPADATGPNQPFRFPVQLVCRPRNREYPDFRGFMGRVESGQIQAGDPITILPAGTRTRVKEVLLGLEPLPAATTGQSVTLVLEDEVDVSRGDLIASSQNAPEPTRHLWATLCWFSETPFDPSRKYLLRHGTRETRAILTGIEGRLDIQTLETAPSQNLEMNDIARVSLKLQQPLATDPYTSLRPNGAFILIDETTNSTVAAGLVRTGIATDFSI